MKQVLKIFSVLLCLLTVLSAAASCTGNNELVINPGSETKDQAESKPSQTAAGDPSSVTGDQTTDGSSKGTPSDVSDTPDTPDSPSTPDTPDTPDTPVTPTPVTPSESDSTSESPVVPSDKPWILHETADAGMSYQNELIFLGDSTTNGMVPYKVLPDGEQTKQVWRGAQMKNGAVEITGTVTYCYYKTATILYPETGEVMLIKDAVAKKKPKYLVITLGVTGGVSTNLSEDAFKTVYRQILNDVFAASPSTIVIVQSIYPVNKENNKYEKSITIDKIQKYNPYILDIVEEFYKAGKKVYYSDAYASLADAAGYLPQDLGNGDGLHLSAKGYQAVLQHLRTHAIPLQ